MLQHPNIDPVAISLGFIDIHWYGLAYLTAFLLATALLRRQCRYPFAPISKSQLDDLAFYAMLGVIIGGRVGYVLFYQFNYFLTDPLWLFKIWQGGMSFHGGMIGAFAAMAYYAQSRRLDWLRVLDFMVVGGPIGLFLGRVANFIGQELWGRPTEVAWGMVFPKDPSGLARHPSQLYEAALEGLVLFGVLWYVSTKPRPRGLSVGLFLLLYGLFRSFSELFREPDALHLGGLLTRGQLLCLPMIAIGAYLLWYSMKARPVPKR